MVSPFSFSVFLVFFYGFIDENKFISWQNPAFRIFFFFWCMLIKGRSSSRLNAAAAENRGGAPPLRVVEALQDFSSAVALLLEVDHQDVLQSILLQKVWDSRQQHRPRANLCLCLG